MQLFNSTMPCIQKLRLYGIGLYIRHPSTLGELTIDTSPKEDPSLQDIIAILQNDPDLELLRLSSMRAMSVEGILPPTLVLGSLPPLPAQS